MRNISAFAAFLCLTCVFSVAQSKSVDDFDQVKIYGGYQYTQLDTHAVQDQLNLQHALDPAFPLLNFGSHQNMHGWNFGGEEDTLAPWFGVVVDVSGSYGENNIDLGTVGSVTTNARTKLRFYTFTGGPQFTLRSSSKVQPFVRALLGGAWESFSANIVQNNVPLFTDVHQSDEGFAYGGGGGADLFFSHRVGLRIAVDMLRTPFFRDTQNNIRGTAGLLFRFGK